MCHSWNHCVFTTSKASKGKQRKKMIDSLSGCEPNRNINVIPFLITVEKKLTNLKDNVYESTKKLFKYQTSLMKAIRRREHKNCKIRLNDMKGGSKKCKHGAGSTKGESSVNTVSVFNVSFSQNPVTTTVLRKARNLLSFINKNKCSVTAVLF